MWRDYWLALSFANLVYLRAWADLLPIDTEFLFHRKTIPGLAQYLGIAADVLALSLVTLLLIRLAARFPAGLAAWLKGILLLAGAVMVALALRSIAPAAVRHSALFGLPVSLGFIAIVAGLVFASQARAIRAAQSILRIAIPAIAVTFGGALINLYSQTKLPPDPPLAARQSGRPAVRVLWIIFDEWDQRLSFSERSPRARMPVIDHLISNSFTANHALAVLAGIPVPQMATVDAVPSLLYGKRLANSNVDSASIRNIAFSDGTSIVLGQGDSIFARVRAQGWNAALAGWYLPYCRVFNPQLSDCYWDEMFEQWLSARTDFAGAAVDESRQLFETRMFSIFGPSLVNVRHVSEFQALRGAALRYAADPSIGLAFIHLNIPHVPYFYDPKIGRLGHYGYSDDLYNTALEQLDAITGEILAAVSHAGLDSKTAIILSSDHPYRAAPKDPWVPYIVHLPGENYGVTYTREFSTIKTATLAMAIARGEVNSPADVAKTLGLPPR
ncbi:MAG TPA: alkaline phosphatase family protein [Bryobacteraceae bacterium]|jgi:hypothetical protein|nr:alkaline phosphatase family protein [Bryobacteraceae bacterium]